jgi:general secretion pathway protein B
MSYILDALRKADAQRERDPSRGIHAHPAPLGGSMRRSNGAARWAWTAVAIAVLAVAGAGWYVTSRAPAPVATAVPEVAVAPAVQAPPVVVTEPAPPPPVAAANEISPPPPARIDAPSHVPARTARPAMRTEPQAPPPAAAAPATSGLPPDAPKVTISGGVYSPNVAQRMLIVNGQVFNEGSEVAPGLAIEKIEPRTAILRFRGARYSVAY